MSKRVYISGKIGEEVISEATRQKFARAEQLLRSKGYEVFNPADERWQRTLRREYDHDKYVKSPWMDGEFPSFYAYALLRDLMVLSTKDAIYMLADWRSSDGANAELDFARATGKSFLFQDKLDTRSHLWSKWWDEEFDEFMKNEDADGTCDDEVDRYVIQHLNEVWLPL